VPFKKRLLTYLLNIARASELDRITARVCHINVYRVLCRHCVGYLQKSSSNSVTSSLTEVMTDTFWRVPTVPIIGVIVGIFAIVLSILVVIFCLRRVARRLRVKGTSKGCPFHSPLLSLSVNVGLYSVII